MYYSIDVISSKPAASEVIVALAICVTASIIYLWILDVTSIVEIKSKWVSRAIWTTVIMSFLSTSAAVYQGVFAEDKYKYNGGWEITFDNTVYEAVISHSINSGAYWGYSEVVNGKNGKANIEISDFDPKRREMILRINNISSGIEEYSIPLTITRSGRLIESSEKRLDFRMKREN